MLQVNVKAVLLAERTFYWRKKVLSQIYGFAAFAAHEVMVMAILGMVVDGLVTHLAFEYTTGFFQEV
jgi:hypothetical protein